MNQTSVDGVTTIWEQGPAPLTGALIFGVGARHETFRKTHLDHNATVDMDTTTFHATGRPEEVTDFLARVCRALTDLPLDRVEREAGVLDAEEGTSEHPALCWALGLRYGLTGPGLLNTSGPGAGRLTETQVRDFVATHFVRDNAVLVLTGPPPEGLSIPLPAGPRPAVSAVRASPLPLPALLRTDVPHPTLSATLPREDW